MCLVLTDIFSKTFDFSFVKQHQEFSSLLLFFSRSQCRLVKNLNFTKGQCMTNFFDSSRIDFHRLQSLRLSSAMPIEGRGKIQRKMNWLRGLVGPRSLRYGKCFQPAKECNHSLFPSYNEPAALGKMHPEPISLETRIRGKIGKWRSLITSELLSFSRRQSRDLFLYTFITQPGAVMCVY